MTSNSFHIAIVGGGITGLSAAYYLQRNAQEMGVSINYSLFEASPRFGGKIVTQRENGFIIEGGPDCFLTRKPWALSLCRDLGLGKELIPTNGAKSKVYVLHRGKLHPLPEGVMLIVPTKLLPFALSSLFSIPGKIRMGMDLFIPPKRENGDETLASFVSRRLGQEALDRLAEPLLSGIHTSDPEHLSLQSSFPQLLETERAYGSLIRGMLSAKAKIKQHRRKGFTPSMFMSLRGGMQSLIEALVEALQPDSLHLNHKLSRIEKTGTLEKPKFKLYLDDGTTFFTDTVLLATSSGVASRLMKSMQPELAEKLNKLRYLSSAVVSLGYQPGKDLPELDGYGFLVPQTEKREIRACSWASVKFENRAPEGHLLLRCFVGGTRNENIATQDEDSIVETVTRELHDILGLQAKPDLIRTFRWINVHPQYELNHLNQIAEFRELATSLGGLYLAGSSYDGVGIPDCVRQAQEASQKILSRFMER